MEDSYSYVGLKNNKIVAATVADNLDHEEIKELRRDLRLWRRSGYVVLRVPTKNIRAQARLT